MGVPPLRIEILTSISGVTFDVCYSEMEIVAIDEIQVPVISLAGLRKTVEASAMKITNRHGADSQ